MQCSVVQCTCRQALAVSLYGQHAENCSCTSVFVSSTTDPNAPDEKKKRKGKEKEKKEKKEQREEWKEQKKKKKRERIGMEKGKEETQNKKNLIILPVRKER